MKDNKEEERRDEEEEEEKELSQAWRAPRKATTS